jgi:hypothetical protein
MKPSVGAFFHFYGTNGVDKMSWVSISVHPGKKLFPPYASNFKKDWREYFVRVQASKGSSVAVASVDGELKFLLSWTSAPLYVGGYDFDKMTPYEQGVFGFLDQMLITDILKLLNKEGDSEDLELYLREYCNSDISYSFVVVSCFNHVLPCLCSSNVAFDRSGEDEIPC